jgi:transposase
LRIEDINVERTINDVKAQLAQETNLSPAFKSSLELLLLLISILLDRLNLNSRNSSKPPSSDPNRPKNSTKKKSNRPPGGQKGHTGNHLAKVDEPDDIKKILIDKRTLPRGETYTEVGYESRQVFDIDISRYVTEYRAQILEDDKGNRYVAQFPESVTAPVQYGTGVKVNSVYMSNYQLLPFNRIEDHFADQFSLPLSAGTVFNFNKDAYQRLESFEQWLVKSLGQESVVHADETGINISGKKRWLHCASSARLTYFMAHEKRGTDAMDEMGLLPSYTGTLVHDHWKPYYQYQQCSHALCNAHHLRELERSWEQDEMAWAKQMKELLLELNKAVDSAGGCLGRASEERFRERYRELLATADTECPPPDEGARKQGQRGRLKRTKSRNLLERLRDYEDDVLRFMVSREVPFTNNQGENDLRMTKVHQKVSGCFRSVEGAKIFCRIRSYISTCRKNGVSSSEALKLLFQGEQPAFMMDGTE